MTQRPADSEAAGEVLAGLFGASKTYAARRAVVHAVTDVDLAVRAGELVAVLGPNGAGKTTALGMLTGLTVPTAGSARLFGRDPRDLVARRQIGVMLQSSGVPDTLRVRELLTAFRGYYPSPMRYGSVVEAAGLQGLEDRLFGTLSGGQQRRVLFGIALCGDPRLVFVDEPTTGLDAEVRRTLWATLRDLAGHGRGVVLTTHYLEEADALADRIVVLNRGRVIAEGSPAQIKSLVPGRRIAAESTIGAEQASGWAGVHQAQRDGTRLELLVSEPEPVLRELLHRDPSVAGLTVTEPTLEDAFLTLTHPTEEAA
jgi:ABC-2 type transport system ATP-binding protein